MYCKRHSTHDSHLGVTILTANGYCKIHKLFLIPVYFFIMPSNFQQLSKIIIMVILLE